MASTFSETFDSVPNANPVTTTNTSFSLITIGANGTFTGLSSGIHGGGARITTNTAGVNARENWSSGATNRYTRFYIRIPSSPPNHMGVSGIRNGTTFLANLQISTAGALRIRNGTTLVATSATTLVADTWYRLEWHWDGSAGTQMLRIYSGANLESPSTYTEQITGAAGTGPADNTTLGILDATASGQVDIDEYAIDDTTWVGPAIASDGTWIRHASGGSWVSVTDRNLSGGTWS